MSSNLKKAKQGDRYGTHDVEERAGYDSGYDSGNGGFYYGRRDGRGYGGAKKNRGGVLPTCDGLGLQYQLISVDYGGSHLSNECAEELKRRTGREYDVYDETNRGDPELLKLYQEKGSTWISGSSPTKLKAMAYPTGFEEFLRISDYDGMESMEVDFAFAFRMGLNDLLAQEGATMEDVRAFKEKLDRTEELYYSIENDAELY